MEIRIPAAASTPVKVVPVNWLPWSVLKISEVDPDFFWNQGLNCDKGCSVMVDGAKMK
jgi:transposase